MRSNIGYYIRITLISMLVCVSLWLLYPISNLQGEPKQEASKMGEHNEFGTLRGKIIDSETKEPVAGAMIIDITRTWIGFSDYKGEYEIILIKPFNYYSVQISCAGYTSFLEENISIEAGLIRTLNVELEPGENMVSNAEIVILSEGGASPKKRSDRKSLEALQPPSITELIEKTKGFKVDEENKRHARGSKSGDVSVIEDGVDLRKPLVETQFSFTPPRDQTFHQSPNTEQYDQINENIFLMALSIPLSTFSIDVDAASYSNTRRFINQGRMPPKDAVRIEEMINYFSYDYDYPQPIDKHPFSVYTEMGKCPWNDETLLMHIGLQGRKVKEKNMPPSNLVFLLDVSGSMKTLLKLPLLKAAFRMLVGQLRAKDKIAIVVYAGSAGLVLPSTPGNEKTKILEALNSLKAGGSTAGGAGIELAYKTAKENFIEEGNNRVILATDGDFNVGVSNDDELVKIIEEKRKTGLFLSTLGFGTGNLKDSKMEKLADKGNGNHSYIDNIQEARKIFVDEIGSTLHAIAKDVKIQIEFNPAHVKAYRLIGYENRMLAKEDFNDDRKDAGELGSGHTVTALYEIVPIGSDYAFPTVDPLKYQSEPEGKILVDSPELATVKLRYKFPDQDKSELLSVAIDNSDDWDEQVSANFLFSAAVAEFGMLLRDSQYKENSSFENVVKMAQKAKGEDEAGYRAEFINLVRTCIAFQGDED